MDKTELKLEIGPIGNFSSVIGEKTCFLALGMGPKIGPKFG